MAIIFLVLIITTVLVSPCQLIIMFLVDRKARKTLEAEGYQLGLQGAIKRAKELHPTNKIQRQKRVKTKPAHAEWWGSGYNEPSL